MNLYHGTSDILQIKNYILPPTETKILREGLRTRNLDCVFATNSKLSAERYARKTCEKFGGAPVIYKVIPTGWIFELHNHEFVASKLKIAEVYA